jgi:hypothetical protein
VSQTLGKASGCKGGCAGRLHAVTTGPGTGVRGLEDDGGRRDTAVADVWVKRVMAMAHMYEQKIPYRAVLEVCNIPKTRYSRSTS